MLNAHEMVELGERPLKIEDVAAVARAGAAVSISQGARERIALGRRRLEEALERGERVYGVNTGIGGNVKISLRPDQMEDLQANMVRQIACATGSISSQRGSSR